MVELMSSSGKMAAVKPEVELLEHQLGPVHKRFKIDHLQGAAACDPLEEPSPLGLRLRKSPSFLDLIQTKLSRAKRDVDEKDRKLGGATEKLKASNFPASQLKIGTWEYKSRYEGDLVGKCYFAKHKLVWEVLDGGLKNKIEIQWSDIVAIKASFPDEGPETLDVVLARQPLFFRETNPQPRKHTLWQATSDFTGGQASIHRRHLLQCQQGFLGKHFEKLIHCDPRLNFLSRQGEILLESPYFDRKVSAFLDLNQSDEGLGLEADEGSGACSLHDAASPSRVPSSSLNNEHRNFISRSRGNLSHETLSPSSVMDTNAIEEYRSIRTEQQKMSRNYEQIKVPGLHASMSRSDLVNCIGRCISEQITSGNSTFLSGDLTSRDILEDITQYLLTDSQLASASNEHSLMSRVNSLCCLLQKDPVTAEHLQALTCTDSDVDKDGGKITEPNSMATSASQTKSGDGFPVPKGNSSDVSCGNQPPAMSRKDSVAELLINLPRIASLPQFL